MGTLIWFGLTTDERDALRRRVPDARWEEGRVEVLQRPRPAEEIWVVGVRAAQTFLSAAPQLPKAVLWVPQGQEPLPLDDWWEGFYAQLREEHADDCTFLQRLSRCPRVLEWAERVEDIPADWFAALTGSPRRVDVEELPFDAEEQQHLSTCADCREEAYDQLQRRAEMRWAMLCPSVDELTSWLEGGPDQRLEDHVMSCGLCKETVQRLAWLLQGAGRLSAEQVEAKFADVSVAQPTAVGAWIAVALRWEQVQTATTVVLAALLAEAVYRSTPLRPMSLARRRGAAGVPAESAPSREQIEAELHERSALALSSTDQWLSLSVEAQAVQVAAGESPARPFAQFRVEFRRGAEVVLAVAAVDGKAQLTLEHFRTAQQRQADHLVIIV